MMYSTPFLLRVLGLLGLLLGLLGLLSVCSLTDGPAGTFNSHSTAALKEIGSLPFRQRLLKDV